MLDRVNTKPKANSKPKNNSSLGEANPSLDNITFDLDIKMNLGSKNWVKNKKITALIKMKYLKESITLKNINIGNITKL